MAPFSFWPLGCRRLNLLLKGTWGAWGFSTSTAGDREPPSTLSFVWLLLATYVTSMARLHSSGLRMCTTRKVFFGLSGNANRRVAYQPAFSCYGLPIGPGKPRAATAWLYSKRCCSFIVPIPWWELVPHHRMSRHARLGTFSRPPPPTAARAYTFSYVAWRPWLPLSGFARLRWLSRLACHGPRLPSREGPLSNYVRSYAPQARVTWFPFFACSSPPPCPLYVL